MALQLGADRELAKDLIQALFLRLWEKRSAQPAVEHWPAYLKKSLTRDTLRALQAGRQTTSQATEATTTDQPQSLSYESLLVEQEQSQARREALQKGLDSLPPKEKAVLGMRFLQGLSYEEIAKIQGTSKQTVYNQIHKAIKRLRELLLLLVLTLWGL